MFLRNTLITAAMLAATAVFAQDAAYWGYADESGCKRNIGKRFNTGTEQGFAIKISKEKAGLLRGRKIVGLRALFTTTQAENVKGFVTSSLGGKNDCEMTVSSITPRFTDYKFPEPYTITGDNDLYAGFTLDFTGQGLSVMSYDQSAELPAGLSWAYTGSGWDNVVYGGAPAVLLVLDEMPSYADAMLKPMSFSSYYTAGKTYTFNGQINNPGTETINSLDLNVQVGNGTVVTKHLDGIGLKPNGNYDFTIDDCAVSESGNLSFDISITNVNGKEDADMQDNALTEHKFIYPENFKKQVLLEMYTGMGCVNCPGGHEVVEAAIAEADDAVLVEHHTYSRGDNLSMQESMDYLWYFNSDMTYAPGIMCNRSPYTDGLTTPVVNAKDPASVNAILTSARNKAPYASIDLNTAFNPDTRVLTATVTVSTIEEPLLPENRINVFLTQNGIYGDDFAQTGAGGNYVHNHAMRGSLTGTWGEAIEMKAGGTVTKTYTYTVPDNIVSTASPAQYPVPAVPEDMQVVAFVMGVSDSPETNIIYNVASAPVTGGASGIEDIQDDSEQIAIYADGGRILVKGDVAEACVYNVSGEPVAYGTQSTRLPEGLYIVKAVTASGKKTTRKIAVR